MKNLIKKILPPGIINYVFEKRNGFYRWYERENNRFWLDYLIGGRENRKAYQEINAPFCGFQVEGTVPDISFLVGTSNQGLLLWRHGKMIQLIKAKGFYGITKQNEVWYAFHKTGMHGKIISFRIENNLVRDIKTVIWGLSSGVHQIDFFDKNKLAVVDSYNNALLIYENIHKCNNLFWRKYTIAVYPNGKLKRGRKSKNYNHFNSIYKKDNNILLLAHNETYKTGNKSEIYILDMNYQVKEIIRIDGSNCHNIYMDNENEIICKSLEGKILINRTDAIDLKDFTRGLSVADDFYIFGGTEKEFDKAKRGKKDGSVSIYDKEFNRNSSVVIKHTQVLEIRRVDVMDFSLSVPQSPD